MSGFGISQSGLRAARAGIETVSNNIANQNVEGYKKQKLNLEQMNPTTQNSLAVGNGVLVKSVTHVTNELMLENINRHTTKDAYFGTMFEKMASVENIFLDNNNIGLMNDLQKFFESSNNLKNDPHSEAFKSIFVDASEVLVDNLKKTNSELDSIKESSFNDIKNNVNKINTILEDIFNINKEMHNNNKFNPVKLDNRNLLETQLSALTNNTLNVDFSNGDDTYYIMIGNHRILDNNSFRKFSFDSSEQAVKLENKNITNEIAGGELGANLKFSLKANNELSKIKDTLLVFSSEFTEKVNDIFSTAAQYEFTSKTFPNITPSDFETTPILSNKELKGIQPGNISFNIHIDEDTLKTYTYNINYTSTFEDIRNNINAQIKNDSDFNGVNNLIDFGSGGITSQFNFKSDYPMQVIDEGNTNFNKKLGYNLFFEGSDLNSLKVNDKFVNDPSSLFIKDQRLDLNVNHNIATQLTDLQHQEIDFQKSTIFNGLSNLKPENQINGKLCFNAETTYQTMKTESFTSFLENISFNVSKKVISFENSYNREHTIKESIIKDFDDLTKVNQDEELMELIKYQAAYNANAKVVSALDEMMESLLRI